MKKGSENHKSSVIVSHLRGHIVGHICPQPDAATRGQTQEVLVFFSRKTAGGIAHSLRGRASCRQGLLPGVSPSWWW